MSRSQASHRGTAIVVDPDAPLLELHTITCCHCQRVVHFKAGQANPDIGGFCRQCMKATCGPCADRGVCFPFEAKLEILEGRRVFLRGVEIIGEPK